ncbi:MAG: tetratricopeptide repeat protein [Acidobacteriota bacterium]
MYGKGLVLFLALAQTQFRAEVVDPAIANRARNLNTDGSALMRQRRYAEAETAYRAALQACESPDERSPCAAWPAILSNLGAVYFHTGRFREAEPTLVRALAYWSSNSKPSADLVNALYTLANVYQYQARYSDALPFYERALVVQEDLAGTTDLSILPLLNGVALLYGDTADYTRSGQSLQRAVSVIELRHAEETADAATTFAALGKMLEAQGDVREAEKWFHRALDIRERLFGKNDPVVADTRVGLALVYRRESRLAEAANLNLSAIAVYQAQHGSKNLPVALNNLGRIRTEQQRPKEAERLFRKAIALWEQQLGPTHPSVAAGLTSLGLVLCSRRKFSEAEPILRRARDIDRESFAANHPRVANDLDNLAVLALDRKRYAEAEDLLQEARAILEKRLPGHPETGKVLARLAQVYHREAKLAESETLYRRALRILEQGWGPENPLLLAPLEDYSAVLRSKQNYAEAARIDAQAMKIRVKQALRHSRPETGLSDPRPSSY